MMGKSTLDINRLKENAISSIQLGIEDFEISQKEEKEGGKPARALSAVRNLFSGVLLLFKYRIALSVPEDKKEQREQLIYKPPCEILPYLDDDGNVDWQPKGKFKTTTIDLFDIKSRFKTLNIHTNWNVIKKLQECRNLLEHLHPINSLGEIADLVAELFPILRDFIQDELKEDPKELLQDSWEILLKQHGFFKDTRRKCLNEWGDVYVPIKLREFLKQCQCESCGSILLAPSRECIGRGENVQDCPDIFQYECQACREEGLITPLLFDQLEILYCQSAKDQDIHSELQECPECYKWTFVTEKGECFWCEYENKYTECSRCGGELDHLELEDLCSGCMQYIAKEMMR
ncbi:hypothetical protein [Commensalibacter communis]|uniref:hypothetical protein n=1 Tax=Commensalibacter communis TaxID=2972786 RepID=UPI0022FF66DB|nr:hypothetical protein [Commensalibacter communis]CAI3922954.1 unnamed protein product [Commensalibacter communis]CAI3931750.1 unnamed protein product [Commensalibacter communis]